jgi:signal peptidase I
MTLETHLQSACCDLVDEVARRLGRVQLKVAGASMVPVLWPGDLVTVERCDPAELEPDAIIVFRQKEKLVIHRLMRRAGDGFIARGDARPCCDDPVTSAEIIGRVGSIVRDGRTVSRQHALWQKIAGAALRRSERCTRLFLRLGPGIRRFGVGDAVFGTARPVRS